MITVEKKLKLFNKVVLEKAKEDKKNILIELEKHREAAFKLQKEESTEKADSFLRAIIDEAYEDKKAMLARAKSDLKKRVLNQRQSLINDLEEAVLKRFERFANEFSYKTYIDETIENYYEDLMDFGNFSIELADKNFNRDKQFFQEALSKVNLKAGAYIKSEEELVGGCIFYNETKDILIDATLRSLLEEHRKEIGQRMYLMLNEVGETNVQG